MAQKMCWSPRWNRIGFQAIKPNNRFCVFLMKGSTLLPLSSPSKIWNPWFCSVAWLLNEGTWLTNFNFMTQLKRFTISFSFLSSFRVQIDLKETLNLNFSWGELSRPNMDQEPFSAIVCYLLRRYDLCVKHHACGVWWQKWWFLVPTTNVNFPRLNIAKIDIEKKKKQLQSGWLCSSRNLCQLGYLSLE